MSSQTDTDLKVMDMALSELLPTTRIRFLEIGVFGGATARWVRDWCEKHSVPLEYWGIDNQSHPNFNAGMKAEPPFPSARLVLGDSAEVFMEVPDTFDMVLCDGCHCFNHVVLDTLHYGAKVRPGGMMLFHDTSPEIQQTMRDPHGPDHRMFYNSVNEAHRQMKFPFLKWLLYASDYEKGQPFGGMTAYKKSDQHGQ